MSTEKLQYEPVDKTKVRSWVWTPAAAAVNSKSLHGIAPPQRKLRFGDVVLVQVKEPGYHAEVETINRIRSRATFAVAHLFVGTTFLAVVGARYAEEEFHGLVPKHARRNLQLLNAGGVVGEVVSANSFCTAPTTVRVMGVLVDQEGQVVNTRTQVKAKTVTKSSSPNHKLIVVCGSGMDSGKTNAGKAVIYSLNAAGHPVAAGKVTGTARFQDLTLLNQAGAWAIDHFAYHGFPSTYTLKKSELEELFWQVYHYLARELDAQLEGRENPQPGFIVLELADGLLQEETQFLLTNEGIRPCVDRVVLACRDALGVLAGMTLLNEWGLPSPVISGRVSNADLGRQQLLRQMGGEVNVFDSMHIDQRHIRRIVA
ncbi:hypothetical protein OAO01_07870 [Oligoflexia bacterium]|nr:hypothetical protein [Oligoflexia bacterium]